LIVLPRLFDILACPSRPRTRGVAGELEVLQLIVADRHVGRAVDEDVGGHEHRVGEEADVDVVLLPRRLVLELGHAAELAELGRAVQDPGELAVLRHRRLAEEERLVRIDPAGEQVDGHLVHAGRHLVRGVALGDGVVVDDGVDAAVRLHQPDPVADRAQVVADVELAGGLDPGEDDGAVGWHALAVYPPAPGLSRKPCRCARVCGSMP
jgi:hypothetical protein